MRVKIRVTKIEDFDHLIVSDVREHSRVWWMNVWNMLVCQWFFVRAEAEYTRLHIEMPVRFVGYRWRFALPLTGWL